MNKKFPILFVFLISAVLFGELNFGYHHGEPESFDVACNESIKYYLRCDFVVFVLNVMLLVSSFWFFLKGEPGSRTIKFYILVFIYFFNIVNGAVFVLINYSINHAESSESELRVFQYLIIEYGAIANMIYVFPLILSIVMFIILICFCRRRL